MIHILSADIFGQDVYTVVEMMGKDLASFVMLLSSFFYKVDSIL